MARPPTDPPDSPGYREITTTTDGVTVSKTATTEEFPVPAIAFEIRSERETRATVRILDVVPEDIPLADVGFHADYGIDYWEVVGDAVVFERDVEPGEEYRTVYGVRSADDGSIKRLLTDPEIDVTDAEERVETDRTSAKHAPSADRDATPERDPTADRTPVGGGARIDDATVPAAATANDVAAALVTQLRRGNVDDAALETLRDALGERITRVEGLDSDADTGIETVEPSIYRLVTDEPPADLKIAEIESELRDIAALSEAERREYGNRGRDIDERERELVDELTGRSTDTKRS